MQLSEKIFFINYNGERDNFQQATDISNRRLFARNLYKHYFDSFSDIYLRAYYRVHIILFESLHHKKSVS